MIGTYQSPLGQIVFEIHQGYLTDMMFDEQVIKRSNDKQLIDIETQLDQYFKHHLESFQIPIKWRKGTPFQHKVWQAMLEIPYGSTQSYSEIAQKIGHPNAVRAVGQACKKNPIGIVVPCHRVIGKDGSLTGYSGKGFIHLKEQLLKHESRLKEHVNHE